jgi:transcriptional regulator with XRE-family HTH domain
MKERIKSARLMAGLSLREAAKGLSVTFQSLSKYENGYMKPDSTTLIKLSKIYGVPIEYFADKKKPVKFTNVEFHSYNF